VPEIYVDADACPVKKEIFRVAERHKLKVYVVTNMRMSVPDVDHIALILVSDAFDAADDWIVEHAQANDIVVADDIPLAARCLQKDAHVIGSKGREFTQDSIGNALASRELSAHLREHGLAGGGPAPFMPKDRSRFLDRFDALIRKCTQ
jgi:uncharacterized protein YaiI (UPF0178 family)